MLDSRTARAPMFPAPKTASYTNYWLVGSYRRVACSFCLQSFWALWLYLEVSCALSMYCKFRQARQIFVRGTNDQFPFCFVFGQYNMVKSVLSCKAFLLHALVTGTASKTIHDPRPFSPPSSPAVLFLKMALQSMPTFDKLACMTPAGTIPTRQRAAV